MPDEARTDLDQLVGKLKSEPNGAFIEIEGHTDSAGPATLNYKLGLDRAEAVKRYLYDQHQVPLHKISVISYGEEKPIAPNKTKEGRAQNRRVVIKVLT
jgi:outer membrane protein OmpA-like peptidoglycan-associated protein